MADIADMDTHISDFDQEQQNENIFVKFDQDEFGTENRSRIVFMGEESESETSGDEDNDVTKETSESDSRPKLPTSYLTDDKKQSNGNVDADSSSTTPQNIEIRKKTVDVATIDDEISTPQGTSYQEKCQEKKLQRFVRIIDSTRCVKDEQSPGIQILLQNNKFAKRYRSKIEQFIVNLVQHADKEDFNKTATDISTQGTNVPTCVDINESLPEEKRNKQMRQAHAIIGCAQFYDSFMIDRKGWPYDEEKQEFPSAKITKYDQIFKEVYPFKESEPTESSDKLAKKKNACFNCAGDHRVNDCPHPKDQNRIRAKRREHMENSYKSSNPGRYHQDPELDSKRAQFVPGTISDSLRAAMGLKPNQLPPYIYNMRKYGYPPGWLKQAICSNATLAMYDRNGRETDVRGKTLADGDCNESRDGVDVSKIIEYPGFSVPVPQGFIDESSALGMPSIQQHQLKKTLMENMLPKNAAKKRKLEEQETCQNKKFKTENAANSNTAEGEDMTGANTSLSESQSLREKNFSFTSCSSISKDFGTPILVCEKGFKSLPSAEKFSQGVQECIPFENLPNSVGAFEKLKNLLSARK